MNMPKCGHPLQWSPKGCNFARYLLSSDAMSLSHFSLAPNEV